jgi:FkbM family methyltransferase
MTGKVKNLARGLLNALNIRITKNQEYDYQAYRIMQHHLKSGSNAVDVGCHKGEFLDHFMRFSPAGTHFAFEPIPHLFDHLQKKYSHNVKIFPYALSNNRTTTRFNYVKNAPAYSGLKKREYAVANPDIEEIEVETELLDNLIPENIPVHFIKIDVEGAEFLVLQGAARILEQNRPVVVFEFGLGASDYYKVKPEDVYRFINEDCNLHLSLLKDFLNGRKKLSESEFCDHYYKKTEYYFVAHP